jgi:hypothetical protein
MQLLKSNWKVEVSSLALATLQERKRNKMLVMPTPSDIMIGKLASHLQTEAAKITSIETGTEFWSAVDVAVSQLVSYNKRRPGELEALT